MCQDVRILAEGIDYDSQRNSTRGDSPRCLVLGPAHAHHSYALFDRCKDVALEGEITSVSWVNPHIVIDLKTKDVPAYRVEWFSLAQLEQRASRQRH